ncbi:prephenate dehydrogenase/arogenate dehydrogenase family protein [Rhodoblastus sp.]|uniref:prephenate dehydrogenase/arogenate dehydrogenase family protein n=1 Tax=Rhodoblastus sp. TaxID=1962975 RepID=UPI00263959DE|nr:prephenate dehydrogenase/arogenate dehydrogenase family protein [Rhodoblastus sp.]
MSERPTRRPGARPRTTIGLIGYGAFGRLAASHLAPLFPVFAYDPACATDPEPCRTTVRGVTLCDAATAAACDLVILAMPVPRLSAAIAAIRPHLRPGATVLDVCSVKVAPAETMRAELPDHVDIIGTHPMFGPQSARGGIKGLKIVICPIRGSGARPLAAYMRKTFGLNAILATPEEHDREAAMVQGLTHLIAKVLVEMEPLPRNMTTASFDLLLRAVDMVRHDAPEVFYAIERMNPFAPDVRRRFFALAADLAEALERNGGPAPE